MNINNCKGCRSQIYSYTKYKKFMLCGILYRHKLKEFKIPMCPCAECIVKVMCKNSCNPYKTYVSTINKNGINSILDSEWILTNEYKRL
jgi:hypothetical protein